MFRKVRVGVWCFCLGVLVAIGVGWVGAAVVTSLTSETWRQNVADAEIVGLMKRVELDWSSDVATSGVLAPMSHWLVGEVCAVTFVADSDVTTSYVVEVRDEDGIDLLQEKASGGLTTATQNFRLLPEPSCVAGPVTVYVYNTTGTGRIVLYVR